MALQTVLPFGEKDSVKNLIFSILTKEYPLKLIDLTNFIRRRYGRSVTFQAVRKAVLQLIDNGVLLREENEFRIDPAWVLETKRALDQLHAELQHKSRPASMDSIKGEVTVLTFPTLAKMMQFWEELIDDWYRKHTKGAPHVNCYQGAHLWEGILYPDYERRLMGQLKKKGIKSYALCAGSTPLDRSLVRFYRTIGLRVHIAPSNSPFDHAYYVATYGELIVQSQYPIELAQRIDAFFRRNKTLEGLNLQELSDIVHTPCQVKLTVIKNAAMAEQINKSIVAQME